jgi:general secretion pathway protein K
MKGKDRFRKTGASDGSVLIVVLWSLVLIGFLAGQYLAHNRGKAGLAANAWESLKQREAVGSVVHLFATDSWPIPGEEDKEGAWSLFSPAGVDIWAKAENESKRININTAADNQIRDKILKLFGQGRQDEADRLADAILDWRDTDTLVRVNGAEAGFYNSRGLAYTPANGPFKVLTELLLVKGVSPDLFWGDPMATLLAKPENEEMEAMPSSLLEEFTIHPKNVKRISILVPGKQEGYLFVIAFLQKEKNRWDVLQLYRTMLVTSSGESKFHDQTESGNGLS